MKELRNAQKEKERELACLEALTECFDCEVMVKAYAYGVERVGEIMVDNYIEYQVFKESTNKNETTSSNSSGKGMSTFGAIISVIAGLFIQRALYGALDIEVEDVLIMVIVGLWIFFSSIVEGIVGGS